MNTFSYFSFCICCSQQALAKAIKPLRLQMSRCFQNISITLLMTLTDVGQNWFSACKIRHLKAITMPSLTQFHLLCPLHMNNYAHSFLGIMKKKEESLIEKSQGAAFQIHFNNIQEAHFILGSSSDWWWHKLK